MLPSATLDCTEADAAALLRHWLSRETVCHAVTRLTGGIAGSVFRLDFDCPPYVAVVKLQPREEADPLGRESTRLQYLRRHTRVPCPEVYAQNSSGAILPHSFLVLEWIPGVGLHATRLAPEARVRVEEELASAVLDLHSHTRDTFGSLEEEGASDWRQVFLPYFGHRREDMRRLLAPETFAQLERALSLAAEALGDQGRPTLTHGDLWAGNIMVEERPNGWHLTGLLDPLYLAYTEVERELAYLQGFHTVGEAFFRAYAAERPLRPGYEFRRLFYWLQADMVELWLGNPAADWPGRIQKASQEILARATR